MQKPSGLSYTDRLFLAALKHPAAETVALRAVAKATRLLSLAVGDTLCQLRSSADPLLRSRSQTQEQLVLVRLLEQVVDLLGGRWDKLPEHRRPHYTPHQRFRILELRRLLALSAHEAAELFHVSSGTILRWEAELLREPEKVTVGSLLRPVPPVRRYADVVRHIVQALDAIGFGGSAQLAATLARAGWRLSRETVRRIRKQRRQPAPAPIGRKGNAVRARRPNDVWMLDLTEIEGLFGRQRFRIATVFDAFSRMPLATRVFSEPTRPRHLAVLLREASHLFRAPRYVLTDRGREFRGVAFRKAVVRLGAIHRFAAKGSSRATMRLERFWRTLKELLGLRFRRPLLEHDLERRLRDALAFYAFFRPHQGLHGATPAEVLLELEPAHLRAIPPPRGRPGERASLLPVGIAYLDRERRYPILLRAA